MSIPLKMKRRVHHIHCNLIHPLFVCREAAAPAWLPPLLFCSYAISIEDTFDANEAIFALGIFGRDDDFLLFWVFDKRKVERQVLRISFAEEALVGIYLLEEESGNRQGHAGSLSVGHAVEVYRAVFAAYPCAYDKIGREGHEPPVGVVVGGTCLTAHRCCNMIPEADARSPMVEMPALLSFCAVANPTKNMFSTG